MRLLMLGLDAAGKNHHHLHKYENSASLWTTIPSVGFKWETNREMRDAIILIFANKQDLPDAMKPHEIQEKLGLTRIRDRNWYVQPSCATTGDGLAETAAKLLHTEKSNGRAHWTAQMLLLWTQLLITSAVIIVAFTRLLE
ncbi:hypothetical protein QQF64_003160 [Cirrhinus molitorella]|uniref:Uncharacterized protein n=1 Tax=Cirrhinus molitorella TaxID=172907 RepID=A0ABR3MJB1_9TELE